jgi:hypothetical protein
MLRMRRDFRSRNWSLLSSTSFMRCLSSTHFFRYASSTDGGSGGGTDDADPPSIIFTKLISTCFKYPAAAHRRIPGALVPWEPCNIQGAKRSTQKKEKKKGERTMALSS